MDPTRIALTCDDAPTLQATDGGVRADPTRMDTIRDILQRRGVEHCVAFVIGSVAQGEEDRLRRWLDAGYELGNHTFDHLNANRTDPRDFLADVRKCDRYLESIGAFENGRSRFFRFPYLQRGRDPDTRAKLLAGLDALGYADSPASTDFFDYSYEEVLNHALASGATADQTKIEGRYVHAACSSVDYSGQCMARAAGESIPLIAFFHFGPASTQRLEDILQRVADRGVEWVELRPALEHPVYRELIADPSRTGLLSDHFLPTSLGARVRRKLAQRARDAGLFGQRRFGPCWPHLG